MEETDDDADGDDDDQLYIVQFNAFLLYVFMNID